jgi:hypothetical protein
MNNKIIIIKKEKQRENPEKKKKSVQKRSHGKARIQRAKRASSDFL